MVFAQYSGMSVIMVKRERRRSVGPTRRGIILLFCAPCFSSTDSAVAVFSVMWMWCDEGAVVGRRNPVCSYRIRFESSLSGKQHGCLFQCKSVSEPIVYRGMVYLTVCIVQPVVYAVDVRERWAQSQRYEE